MTTTATIAGLPRDLREELNRRLHETADDAAVTAWLNSSPELKSNPVPEEQVVEWRSTAHLDWLTRQETFQALSEIVAEADEWKARLGDSLTDKFAGWLVPQYMAAARVELAAQQGPERWALLRTVSQDLVALRRGDQWAERLRLERARLDLLREAAGESKNAEFEEWLKRPEVRDKVCPKVTRERVMKRFQQVVDHVMTGSPLSAFEFMDDEENAPSQTGDSASQGEPGESAARKSPEPTPKPTK